MKTLNKCALVFFVLLFLLAWVNTAYIPTAMLFACAVSVPLYLMGLVLRWFVRGLVK
jgi:hypothetical protein